MKHSKVGVLASALGILMSLVACGGDDPVPPNTIVDVAVANGNFTVLAAALTRADLVDDLSGAGPFTVFAPTDAAFNAAGITVATVATLPVATLQEILTYHVVAGSVASTAIPQHADALSGLTLWFTTTGGVKVNDANVTTADVSASNGIIHVVDKVLMPPTIVDMAGYAGLSSLAGALTSANLIGTLSGTGPFTVFAPTNAAFAALPAVPTGDALTAVLTYHVLAGETLAAGLPAAAQTLSVPAGGTSGYSVVFNTASGAKVNQANIVITDIKVTNGVIHVIDAVILPSNIAELATYAGLTSLLGVVGDASAIPMGTSLTPSAPLAIAAALAAPSVSLTVFAPTNAAFTAIASTTATLTADQKRDVLLYHVLGMRVPSTALSNGNVGTLLSLTSADPQLTISTTGPTVKGACNATPSAIGPADVFATNGVIHLVNSVLLPIGC